MKKAVILLLITFPFTLFSQHLKCCESTKEVREYLRGIWKEQNSKIYYEYRFEKEKGHLTEMEKDEATNDYMVIDDHPYFNIIKYSNGFKLKFISLYSSWTSELKYLNSKKMILVTKGEVIEYIKVNNTQ